MLTRGAVGGVAMAVAYHYHYDGRTTLRRLYTRLTKDKKQRYHAIGWWCSTCGEQYDANLQKRIPGALSDYEFV